MPSQFTLPPVRGIWRPEGGLPYMTYFLGALQGREQPTSMFLLIHLFINSVIFAHDTQFHIEVPVSFSRSISAHAHACTDTNTLCPFISWVQLRTTRGVRRALLWLGISGVTNHYFTASLFPAQAVNSVTKWTTFCRCPTRSMLCLFVSLTPALLLLLLLKFLLKTDETTKSPSWTPLGTGALL